MSTYAAILVLPIIFSMFKDSHQFKDSDKEPFVMPRGQVDVSLGSFGSRGRIFVPSTPSPEHSRVTACRSLMANGTLRLNNRAISFLWPFQSPRRRRHVTSHEPVSVFSNLASKRFFRRKSVVS